MSAFPTAYPIMREGYQVDPMDGAEYTRAMDGTLRGRRLWSETRRSIRFRLDLMSAADFAVVEQFYEDYKFQKVTWTDNFTSTTYSVDMTAPPRISSRHGPYVRVDVQMEGVPV